MKVGSNWLILDTVGSTQTEMATLLMAGSAPDVIYAHDQLQGRGRLGRTWLSHRLQSLTMSIGFLENVCVPSPWLIGMACAIATAEVLSCQLQWPNDLVANGRKLGGVLIELLPDHSDNLVPIVGIGVNISQTDFDPAIAHRATSVLLEKGVCPTPLDLANEIVHAVQSFPEPSTWGDLKDRWMRLDDTPGKLFLTPTGQRVTASGIDNDGCLVARVGDEIMTLMAAEALFQS